MKKKLLFFSLILSVATCLALCVGLGPKHFSFAAENSPLGKRYLEARNITPINSSANGISITIDNNQIINYLKISVDDWTNITEFNIKRIIVNKAFSLTQDDTGIELSTKPNEFYFSSNGDYVVTYKLNNPTDPDKTYGIYCPTKFERSIDTSKLKIENANLYTKLQYQDCNTNLLIADGNFSMPNNTTIAPNGNTLYNIVFEHEEITGNVSSTIKINNKDNQTLETELFDIFTKFPTIKYYATNNVGDPEEQVDVLSLYNGLETLNTNTKFFNKDVVPALDFYGFSNEEIKLFNDRFNFTFGLNEIGSDLMIAYIIPSALNYEQSSITQEQYKICKNPNAAINLHMGSSNSATLYKSENFLTGIFTVTGIYPSAIDFNKTVKYSDYANGKVVIVGQQDTNGNLASVDEVYALPITTYRESGNSISISEENNKILVSSNLKQVPIDIIIIDSAHNQFEILDVLKNTDTFEFTIKNPGNYTIVAKYRGIELDLDNNIWLHKKLDNVNILGAYIQLTTGNTTINDNQITNSAVNIFSNKNFRVLKNGETVGEYSANHTATFAETGFYTVIAENQIKHFSIISTSVGLINYSVSAFENILPTQILLNNNPQAINSDYTILNQRGIYTIINTITNEMQIEIGNETTAIYTNSQFEYQVNVQPISFHIATNVKNGDKTSKNIILDSVEAAGNWSITINFNGKLTTYTKDQFNALSAKNRTLSKNGDYTITIEDESGNQFQFMFEKYFKLNAGLIILIVVLAIGLAIGLFFIIRLRLKAKVR